jgi:hypothetical protein
MFAYDPQVTDRSGEILGASQMRTAETQAQMYNQLGNNIGGALSSLGEMYGKFKDKKDMLAGMDKAVMGMSDLGAITPDFRDKYLSADNATRPFLFQALASPMFQAYQKKQGYQAYAEAMKGVYGNSGGGMAGAGSDFFDF